MNEDLVYGLVIALIIIVPCVFMLCVIFTIDYALHAYPIEILQNNKVIYSGVKACAEISSTGDTTTISISHGFLCLFPKATITGRNIEVRTK